MADLKDEIKLSVDASGVETGVRTAKRSIDDLGRTVADAGKKSGDGFNQIGRSASAAGQDVDRVTRRMVNSLQRQIAAAEAGGTATRAYQESIARLRGANMDVLKPYLDQLDAAKRKQEQAAGGANKLGNSLISLKSALAAMGITASIGGLLRMADASTNLASRLSLVTDSAAELSMVQGELFRIAQKARVSFVDLGGTYAQVARSTKELGVSQTALLGVIETISQAVTISGGSAQSAQAALTQLSQGFAAGALRGEELNSVMEQTPRLAQAIAEGMGIGIGQLRAMGQAGELTAERVLGALENAAASVQDEFAQMAVTVEQASTNAANSVTKLVGAFDNLTGASSGVAGVIQGVSKAIDWLARDLEKLGSQGPLRKAANEVLSLERRATRLRNGLEKGFYGPQFQLELDHVNKKLAEAKARFNDLYAAMGAPNPADQYNNYPSRSAGYANEAARQAKLREDANAFLLRQSGVPASYLKDMQELIRLKEAGALTEEQYTAALKKQQDQLIKYTGTVRKSTSDYSAAANEYRNLITSINEKIAAERMELSQAGKLTTSQQLTIKLQEQIASGKSKLTAAQQAEAQALLAILAGLEQEKKVRAEAEAAAKAEAQAQEALLKTRQAATRSVEDALRKARDEERAHALAASTGITLAEAIERLALARAEENYQKEVGAGADSATLLALQQEIEARKGLITVMQDRGVREANAKAAEEAAKEWEKTSQLIGDTLADYIMGGGRDAASYLKRLFATLVLRPVVEVGVNSLLGAVGLGGSSGGGGGLLGTASNAMSAYNLFTGVGGNMGALSGALGGSMSWANAAGSIYANTTGTGISGLLATNGAYGTAGASSSALAGAGAAAAVIAAPLLVGMIAGMLDKGDTFSGAAYATSRGDDRLTQVIEGALNPNMNTGDLPDRAALEARLRELGAADSHLAGLNDRTLHRMMLLAEAELNFGREGGPLMNWSEWGKNNAGLADFYRGPGYAFAEDLGWWEVQDMGRNARDWDSFYTDPAITETSRRLAESVLAPLDAFADMLGLADEYKVATGMAYNDKTGKIWGGLQFWENDESVLNWGKRDFENTDAYVRALFHDSLGVLEDMGLPEWAQKQSDDAQAAMMALEGERIGERAAEIYSVAASSITGTYSAIETLIKIIPDLATASQDAVYGIGEAFGSLEGFASAYSDYVQNFYSEAERFDYIRAGINDTLKDFDIEVFASTTREQFREMVEAQDLATESGRAAFAALLQVSSAFAEITPAADALAESIGSDLTGVLTEGLLGNLTGADLGGAMADVVIGGVYNALASNVGAQISEMMMSTVVTPLITAAMTGSSIAESVSQAAISNMVASAQAAAQALNAVLSSPEFQEALSGIDAAFRSITVSMPRTPYYTAYQSAKQVSDYQKAVKSSADEAARAAEAIRKSWQSISDTLVDEVRRIRGELADAGEQSALYWEAQFAIDTAAARAGDEEAAKRLKDVSRSLLDAAGREAMTMLELQQMRAYVAQSLQDTAGYAQAIAGGALNATPKAKAPATITPAPVFTNQAPIVVQADPQTAAEVRHLRQVVETQGEVMRQMQNELVRYVRRWDADGVPVVEVTT